MNVKNLMAALLLTMAGLQTAWGQGFRVYKSDGTVAQFSFRTDSIVFYDNIGSDEDFGPFMPVNQMIVGTWYKPTKETITVNEDGTTDYIEGATYKFFPYQGTIILYNSSNMPLNIIKVHEVTAERMIVNDIGSMFFILTRAQSSQLVTSITLSETSISLQPDETKQLTVTVLPANADNKEVAWESNNDAVAEVNSSGRVTANAVGTCVISCCATDGSGVYAECQVKVQKDNSGIIDGREYIDLDLPSGTLWAMCNVGANSPEEYGDYFAWGETEPKSEYSWSTYKWCNGSYNTMTKYCIQSSCGYNGFTDSKTELEADDDVATANWGNGWQMPSYDQFIELYNSSYTIRTWTTQNGVNGRKITSKSNGNSIFLPTAGFRDGTRIRNAGSFGLYWSHSLDTTNPYLASGLDFNSSSISTSSYDRYVGRSVRPVRKQ